MSSNFLLLCIFFVLISCGLKTNPTPLGNSKLPSLTDKYSYKKESTPVLEDKKEDKKKKDQSDKQ